MNAEPNEADAAAYNRLLENPPKLHFWGGEWKVGGLGLKQRDLLARCVRSVSPPARVIETGAGLSTLIFLALGARVTSFFTKDDLRERIAGVIGEFDLPADRWDFVIGTSEFTFPKYLDRNPSVAADIVLVDGGHLIHTVFADFTYAFACLKQGGLMLIDDLQASSVSVLYGVLRASNFVEQVDIAGKTAAFRKTVKARLPGNWGEQPVTKPVLAAIAAEWNA